MSKRADEPTEKLDRTHVAALGGAAVSRVLALWDGGHGSCVLPAAGALTIGRALECDLAIDHSSVSRKHAVLRRNDAGISIEDLGSANGTWINGRGVAAGQVTPVAPGDAVEVGKVTLVIQLGSARAEKPAPRGVTASPMERVHALVDRVARSNVDVLLLGETGVGKEVTAQRIHALSSRADQPFVQFNCAALPESLAESELFGYQRGAFTGAVQAKPGLLETAHQGTVFLDELCELHPSIQAKLLRVVETRQVLRLGSLEPRAIDVRFIQATNRDINAEMQAGRFRPDLYHRLNGISIVIPPLRERLNEIEPLAKLFVAEVCQAERRTEIPISAAAMVMLLKHPWPGNVRELRKVMARAVLLCRGHEISAEEIVLDGADSAADSAAAPPIRTGADDDVDLLRQQLKTSERQRIIAALERADGNQTKAAEILGVSRRTLLNWLDAFDISRPRKGKSPV